MTFDEADTIKVLVEAQQIAAALNDIELATAIKKLIMRIIEEKI